jgi:membrane protein implicated in regulation of membrane protease activity
MGLLVGLLLAVFVLDEPWSWVALSLGAGWEIAEAVLLIRWSQKRRAEVGTEALVGRVALVAADCLPDGQVRVAGELWRARCDAGARVGEQVVVRAVDGLTLAVEHAGDA